MKIETDRLILEEITMQDFPMIHKLHSVPEVAEFNTIGIPRNECETKDLLIPFLNDQHKYPRSVYCWKIVLKERLSYLCLLYK